MSKEADSQLPSSEGLGDVLDEFLRSGGDFFTAKDINPRISPAPESTTPRSELTDVENEWMDGFFKYAFPTLPQDEQRQEAERIYLIFSFWKREVAGMIQQRGIEEAREALEKVTLGGLATYAKEELDEAAREKGRAVPNTVGFRLASERAEYWDRLYSITEAAAHIEETGY